MISKEQIAHELAMVYMNNKYGINVRGDFTLMMEPEMELLKPTIFLMYLKSHILRRELAKKDFWVLKRKRKSPLGAK